MGGNVKPIPDGFHTVTSHITVNDCNGAIEFYKEAFGAVEIMRLAGPDGKSIMHAEIRIGDSIVMLNDEFSGPGPKSPKSVNGTTSTLHLYVEDCDAAFNQAVAAGAAVQMPPTDMFWGDRFAGVIDPFGHNWSFATHKEDLTPEEIDKRAAEWMANMGEGCS